MANTYTVTATNGTTYTVTVSQGVSVAAMKDATAITTPAGTETATIVNAGGLLRKITLSNLKTWIAGAASSTWGSITGTLANQTDLANALGAKVATADTTATPTAGKVALWGGGGNVITVTGTDGYNGTYTQYDANTFTGDTGTIGYNQATGKYELIDNNTASVIYESESCKPYSDFTLFTWTGGEFAPQFAASGDGLHGFAIPAGVGTMARTSSADGHVTLNEVISRATVYDALEDTFLFPYESASTYDNLKTAWSNIKAKLKTYFDGLYAMISNYKTSSFTAVKGGRYHVAGSVAADQSVAVTDPSVPSPAAGDVYKVVIVSGYVRIGSADYFKSRHEITRHYTGSAWETIAPFYSEAPDYAAAVRATARTNLGAGATGDSLFTAASVAAVETALGFYLPVTKVASADVSKTADTTYANDADITFTVVANARYRLDFWIYIVTGAGGLKLQWLAPSGDTLSFNSVGTYSNFAGTASTVNNQAGTIVLTAQSGVTSGRSATGSFILRIGDTGGTLALQWAQNSSDAASSTRKTKSFATLTRLP